MRVKRISNLIKACRILFLVVLFVSANSGQAANDTEKWTRVTMDNGELSIALPAGFIVDAEKREDSRYRLFGFQNGVAMTVKVSRESDAKTRLERVWLADAGTAESFTKGDINGKRFSSDKTLPYIREKIYLASGKHFYNVELRAGDRSKAEIAKFLNTLNIEGKPLFVQNGQMPVIADEITFGSLKTNEEVVEAFSRETKKNKVQMVKGDLADPVSRYKYDGLSRPAIVLNDPRPRPAARGILNSGFPKSGRVGQSAILEVTLRADGTVGDITAYSDADKSYLEACKAAAQKIRFIPAQLNGQNVDVKDIIDYSVIVTVTTTVTTTLIR